MKFSERYGYKPVRDVIQLESMDEPLRNGLWNLLHHHYWDKAHHTSGYRSGYFLSSRENRLLKLLSTDLWLNYFKYPLDDLGNDWKKIYGQIRQYYFGCEWFEVYDFIEFINRSISESGFKDKFATSCNNLFEKEMSAYRFVDGIITQITNEQEVAEIEQATKASPGPVTQHLRRSLELMSDRTSPDYRNSVKESISAVESLASITLDESNGSLGKLLKKLKDEIGLHPSLGKAFSKLYGYTSDEGGIRHALTDVEKVDFNDAKFMLVVCSAFINFVEGKAQDGR
jgi:hypothetical protein